MKKTFIFITTFAITCLVSAQQLVNSGEYWFDGNYASRTSIQVTPSANYLYNSGIDCNTLGTGLHALNMRFRQTDGQWSSTVSQLFLKTPPVPAGNSTISAYEYWLDNTYASKVTQTVSPSASFTLQSAINLGTVSTGIHVFNVRFKQSNGAWSSVISQIFVKVPLEVNNYNIVGYEYWLDNATSQKVSQAITPTANFFFASGIDLSAVSTGIHAFNMRFKQSNGHWSGAVTQMFLKQPVLDGDNAITTYEYWFNESFEDREIFITPTEPIYTAINDLNIENSTQFLNIFHARFKDRNNAYSYVDEYYYSINLNLTVFLESLYSNAINTMRKAQNESGDNFTGNIADTITIQIREGTAPYNVLLNVHGVELQTNGTCHLQKYGTDLINLPNSSNTTYYLVVKHRNSVETWSQAITLGPVSAYNFTDSQARAYGNNLAMDNGVYLIYGGDVNQDGAVDIADMTPVDNDSAIYESGYLSTDVNGDGIIDTADMTIVDNNAAAYVGSATP